MTFLFPPSRRRSRYASIRSSAASSPRTGCTCCRAYVMYDVSVAVSRMSTELWICRDGWGLELVEEGREAKVCAEVH
jgi:hypothetical protein